MSSDISRQRFDPGNDLAGVLMQQGRVLLDADWNEWVEILDRRLRAETVDIVGHGVVPKETPHGFEIGIAGTSLTIGPGRIYLDGILAENHGQAPSEWDPVLAELRGTASVPFSQQPYLPDPKLIDSPPTAGGPHLVYLVAWRREVTWLENPDLIEAAVGVDSTSRWQIAWQVRVLPNVGAGTTCSSGVPQWDELIKPSAGRLSSDTFNIPGDPDPCQVPPMGGYKGLENRLYRVEIHSVNNATGAATFKWARHNASVASPVDQMKGTELLVDLIGRDADLRFKIGDWVEITDDARELAGLPGFMRNIADVSDATRKITIDLALPPGAFPLNPDSSTLPERHTRIRKWDQKGKIRATNGTVFHDLDAPEADEAKKGAIPVNSGTALLLEDGIQITFSMDPVGGRFHNGDYWVFAARTADASIETLKAAPPRGIHYHYCRLALVTFPGPPVDCRILWPPEFGEHDCACSVCVTPESHNQGTLTVQQGIDQVKAVGGTVCLAPGMYQMGEVPLQVDGVQSVTLRGHGWRTVLVQPRSVPAIVVQNCLGFTMEDLTLLTAAESDSSTPDVSLSNCVEVTFQGCYFAQLGIDVPGRAAVGLGGFLVKTCLRENVFLAAVGIGNLPLGDPAATGFAPLLTLEFVCLDNTLLCARRGVSLEQFSLHLGETRLAGNSVHGCAEAGLTLAGAVIASVWGGSRLEVVNNHLRVQGDGLVVGTDDARIDGNDVGPETPGTSGKDGIVLAPGLLRTPLNRTWIIGNRLIGLQGDGIGIRTPIASAMIKQNFLSALVGGGIVMKDDAGAEHLSIENNQLLVVADVTSAQSENQSLAGIQIIRVQHADVVGNVLDGVAPQASLASSLAGIQIASSANVRLAGNRVTNIGPLSAPLQHGAGIEVVGSFERLDVLDNLVRRSQQAPGANTPLGALWWAVRIGPRPQTPSFSLGNNLFLITDAFEWVFSPATLLARPRGPEIGAIRGNTLESIGSAPTVELKTAGSFIVNDNRGRQALDTKAAVLSLQAGALMVSSNLLEAPRDNSGGASDVALLLTAKGLLTVLGNVTTGGIRTAAGPLGDPWKPLNVISP